ncbi:Glycosyl hydrolases family 16 [Frankineae bacterium MT45]|nr:Glycosyl hydrolases family 16 [Frankineae bacterium MT45]
MSTTRDFVPAQPEPHGQPTQQTQPTQQGQPAQQTQGRLRVPPPAIRNPGTTAHPGATAYPRAPLPPEVSSELRTSPPRRTLWLVAVLALLLAALVVSRQVKSDHDTVPATSDAMPVGNLPGWTQVFAEDFTKPAPLGTFSRTYASKWTGYNGANDTSKQGTYRPDKVLSVHDGMLDMYLHTEGGEHLVAAPAPLVGGRSSSKRFGSGPGSDGGQTYGRYSVRMRVDPVYGYKIAFLLWPDSTRWPDDGEIDFPEMNLDGTINAGSLYAQPATASNPKGVVAYQHTGVSLADWHTVTIDWTPGKVVFYIDGTVVFTNTTQVPHKPMHWILQAETNLDGTEPTNDTAAGHIDVDWATVYKYTPK